MCSICTAIINIVVFLINQNGSTINSTVAIIICSVVFGVIALPMLVFLVFHIYLSITGKTTRELLKKLDSVETHENQWCNVDPPLFDPYLNISEEERVNLNEKLGNF